MDPRGREARAPFSRPGKQTLDGENGARPSARRAPGRHPARSRAGRKPGTDVKGKCLSSPGGGQPSDPWGIVPLPRRPLTPAPCGASIAARAEAAPFEGGVALRARGRDRGRRHAGAPSPRARRQKGAAPARASPGGRKKPSASAKFFPGARARPRYRQYCHRHDADLRVDAEKRAS